jgi:hypothetical protein
VGKEKNIKALLCEKKKTEPPIYSNINPAADQK